MTGGGVLPGSRTIARYYDNAITSRKATKDAQIDAMLSGGSPFGEDACWGACWD